MSELVSKAVDEINAKLDGGGIENSVKFVIENEGSFIVDSSGARISDEAAECTISASPETFRGLRDGTINPATAYMTGKVKIAGNMAAAMQLGPILS
jgi:putative sterol carrier protein